MNEEQSDFPDHWAHNVIANPDLLIMCIEDAIARVELVAIKLERDRIIKLLEGIAIETKSGEIAVMELLSAIEALIKEGQK